MCAKSLVFLEPVTYKKHCSQPPADDLDRSNRGIDESEAEAVVKEECSIYSPSPPTFEPISPILKQRSFGTTTYGWVCLDYTISQSDYFQ